LLVLAITTLLQVVLVQGIITQLASESYLGFRETAGKAFRTVQSRLFPLTGAVIIEFVIIFALICVIGVMTVFLPICAFLFIGLIYIWLAMFSLMPPVIILERTSVGLGLRRAWSLGKARIWQILGLTLVIGIINSVITLVCRV